MHDVSEIVCAFATRAHPTHGELRFPALPTAAPSIYLDEQEMHSYRAGKVIHNCLLADRFPADARPVKGIFANGWPEEVQRRVIASSGRYGYAGPSR